MGYDGLRIIHDQNDPLFVRDVHQEVFLQVVEGFDRIFRYQIFGVFIGEEPPHLGQVVLAHLRVAEIDAG